MTAQPMFEDPRLQRMEQASLWLQRMRNAGQDERVVEEWLDWCQRDPLNQQAFDEMAAVWEPSGQLSRESPGASAVSRTRYPRRLALAASLAGLGLATVTGAWWLNRPLPDKVLTSEFSSPIGVNSVQTLADGSLLELGGGTRVTVAIGAHARRVELHEGEVFVTVSHDASRPFSVDTGRLEVVATGTAFDVLRTAERTTVTVTEGSVDARYEGQAAAAPNVHRLRSSEQLVYSHASHGIVVRQSDPRNAVSWRSGMLQFTSEPLSEVIATVNRYAPRPIVIEDPGTRALSFTGTANTDRIDVWLHALPRIFNVAVVELADGRQLIRPPEARTD